jgi:hypothetical protein
MKRLFPGMAAIVAALAFSTAHADELQTAEERAAELERGGPDACGVETLTVPPGYHAHRTTDGRTVVHADSNFGDPVAHAGIARPWPKTAVAGQTVTVGTADPIPDPLAADGACPGGVCPTPQASPQVPTAPRAVAQAHGPDVVYAEPGLAQLNGPLVPGDMYRVDQRYYTRDGLALTRIGGLYDRPAVGGPVGHADRPDPMAPNGFWIVPRVVYAAGNCPTGSCPQAAAVRFGGYAAPGVYQTAGPVGMVAASSTYSYSGPAVAAAPRVGPVRRFFGRVFGGQDGVGGCP